MIQIFTERYEQTIEQTLGTLWYSLKEVATERCSTKMGLLHEAIPSQCCPAPTTKIFEKYL